MKKAVLILLTISSLLALGLTSCQKDAVGTTTFTATLEDCQEEDGKTVLTGTSIQWTTGDRIKVFGTAGSGVYEATVRNGGGTTFTCLEGDAGGAPYRAVYPASAANDDGTIDLPVVQVTTDGSLTGFPMYTESNGTNLDFKNLCGILRLRLQKSGVSITAIEVTGDIELTGDFTVAYNSGTPTLTYSGHGTKATMMTCSTPQSIARQKDFDLFLPVHTYSAGMRIRIYSSDGGVCTKTVTAGHSVRIQRSKITTITLSNNNLTFTPNSGALPGLFTIDDQGHQVRFSQGNLQYTTLGTHTVGSGGLSKGTWRFASEQYEYNGPDNENISSIYPKWIDLFGWGTSGWNSGAICYQPWSTSFEWSDYYPGGSYTNSLTGVYAEADWAYHNAISNGGNSTHQWRVLTNLEWEYLLFDRPNASVKIGSGNINGVGGIIILPDNWIQSSECTFNYGFPNEFYDYTLNSYSLTQWKQMENAGAVFLPAAENRNGRTGTLYYWSSSIYDEFYAYNISYDDEGLVVTHYDRFCGFSVRSVRDNN